MGLLSGKINSFNDETLLFEMGDTVDFIAYVHKGCVIKTNGTKSITIDEGNFICHDDIYSGFYSYDYTAMAGTEIMPIPASSGLDIVQFLTSNPTLHKSITYPICCLCKGLYEMYVSLYNIVNDFYTSLKDDYISYMAICDNTHITAGEFSLPHNADTYTLSGQAFGKNLTILRNIVNDADKEKNLAETSGIKYLKLQIEVINRAYIAYDDMFFYLKSLIEMFASENDSCLFSLTSKLHNQINSSDSLDLLTQMKEQITSIDDRVKTQLNYDLDIDYNRVNFFFMVADHEEEFEPTLDGEVIKPVKADFMPEVTFEDCDLNDILLQLCNYAELPKDKYDTINKYVVQFLNLPDKYSKDTDVRAFRKSFCELYYELYEAVFFKYATSKTANILVKMFLDYGLLDERLVTDMQIHELMNVAPLNPDERCGVYRMSDWLLRVYHEEDIPSKNEFDQEYADFVREIKKNEGLSATEEKRLLEDAPSKVHYEIQNMLKYNSRLLNGNLLSFYPMLHMESFEKSIEAMTLTTESIMESIDAWKEYDYSVFYREIMYANPAKRIEKEVIQKEIYPVIILFPVAGVNGVMWQDISGKRSNSSGRFFLPSFFNGSLEDTMLTMLGRFRWELCKTLQGVSWNNIQVPSLTSEYIDYIQFYRKNKELTADKKDAIKTQLTKCHNNMRDFFVYDYTIWLKYESSGAMRLNKFSRRMLATYCPLAKKYRDKQAAQPIYEEAMKKFNINRLKKVKEYQSKITYYQKKCNDIPSEIIQTRNFYEL